MEFPGIRYRGDPAKTVELEEYYYENITYYKTIEDFDEWTMYSGFVKEVEKLVRQSTDYKKFVHYVKHVLGFNFCQIFPNIHDELDATIELHHGPFFTLYDIVDVILQWHIRNGVPITTFAVARKVIEEHFALRVGVIALSKTAHEMVHNNDVVLNVEQCIGNVHEFVVMYADYFSMENKYKLYTYAEMFKKNRSFDKGILDLDYIEKLSKKETFEFN